MKEDDGEQLELPLGEPSSWWHYENQCIHNWVKYEGFTEIYEFCTKCNQKRELNEQQ